MGELISLYEDDEEIEEYTERDLIIEYTTIDYLIKYFPGPGTLYLYLRKQSIIQYGKICVSIPVKELEVICSRKRNTIRLWIKKLRDGGVLKIRKGRNNNRIQNIYEIGYTEKVDNTIIEKYYF